jgi:hypothetical protein
MSREASVQFSIRIRKGNQNYVRTKSFQLDITGSPAKGPVPGAITAAITGTTVDLSQLSTPGICSIENLDPTNFVEVGIREPVTGLFYPLLEIGPGEEWPFKFSRNLLEEYTGTGTGTSAPTNQLQIKANIAACVVVVKAFER